MNHVLATHNSGNLDQLGSKLYTNNEEDCVCKQEMLLWLNADYNCRATIASFHCTHYVTVTSWGQSQYIAASGTAARLTACIAGQPYDFSETFILFGSTFLISVSVNVSEKLIPAYTVHPFLPDCLVFTPPAFKSNCGHCYRIWQPNRRRQKHSEHSSYVYMYEYMLLTVDPMSA